MSPTQFAASVLGLTPPPGSGKRCWLCGGECGDEARDQADVISPTFTQHNLARCADSSVVCGGCESLTLAASWQKVVADRSMDLKVWTQAGWHCYSHFIAEPDVYECPRPGRVREILLSPPSNRWLLGINESGKKHTVFRSVVNSGGGTWAVHYADILIRSSSSEFGACLGAFEAMVAAGFSKASVVSGELHPASLMKVGLSEARRLDNAIAPYRSMAPDVLALVSFCARGVAALQAKEDGRAQMREAPPPVGRVASNGQWEMCL